jgi:hypothetical protein
MSGDSLTPKSPVVIDIIVITAIGRPDNEKYRVLEQEMTYHDITNYETCPMDLTPTHP